MTSSAGQTMRAKIGVSAALATPFTASGEIDWPAFAAHAGSLLGSGMQVVTAFGTTGEGVSIPAAARAALYENMAAGGIRSGQLVECVYGPSSADAGAHMRRSFEAGASGILLTPPHYFKQPPEEGIYRWYCEAFQAAGASCGPVILYNIPALTGVTIGPRLVARLRVAFPEIVAGVKDSSGDWAQTTALLAEHRDLAILVGHEGHLARAVREGASGAISGVANFAPKLLATLVSGEDVPLVDAVLEKLLTLPVVPAIKAVLAARTGRADWYRTRAPLEPITDAGERATCAALAAMAE
ncbi:dihydrodipicolinate synthase family protein [Rhizobium sp. TRM95111]|uniref:dihydrodipicolinate synthase family protein n=1 Tax=Rhizobium alarense TaxID=2846851 RepID=UPI001F3E53DF|nr:dihydrodipicolinate synthase family protein [Rhizobium alarense]MCF3639659.1 dihydrodipicolinate synthase family protein [Rhizobium alarense]